MEICPRKKLFAIDFTCFRSRLFEIFYYSTITYLFVYFFNCLFTFLFQCAFLIWCMSPLDGSSTIYFKIVLPLFKRNQSKVDSFIDRAKEKAGGFTDQMISEAGRIASEAEKKTD